jgi:hypothetical protein
MIDFRVYPDDDVSKLTNAEKWTIIRARRNNLLSACDYTALSDYPITTTKKADWKKYRQALRDIPQVFKSPDDVVFPPPPE